MLAQTRNQHLSLAQSVLIKARHKDLTLSLSSSATLYRSIQPTLIKI